MKGLIIFSLIGFLSFTGCKDRDPKITQTTELSEEMKAYFVNYAVGTKWIYQDTVNPSIYDTIELISKENFDVVNGNTLDKGFVLYYQPKKSKDFKVRVSPGNNNSCHVKIDPIVSGSGAVVFESNNGEWVETLSYYDSIDFKGTWYHNVIQSPSSNLYHYEVAISSSKGIVFFHSSYFEKSWGASLKLIKTITP